MDNNQFINIEVAYATPQKQLIISLAVSPDTSVVEAIHQSEIATEFSELLNRQFNEATSSIGIFGKRIDISSYVLQEGDRIEIYRPLNKTPNQKRLERAKNAQR